MQEMNEWAKKYTIENLRIETMVDLLNLKHQQLFTHFLYGLESLIESYYEKKNEDLFMKVREIKNILIKRDRGFKMLGNGFAFNQTCINSL